MVIQPCVKSSQILVCPSDTLSQRKTHGLYGENATRSYTATEQVMGRLPSSQVPLSLAAVPSPSLTIMVAERDQPNFGNWGFYSHIGNLGSELTFRHLSTANFLYCDGHVKAQKGITGSQYPALSGYSLHANGSAICSYGATMPE